AARAFSGSDDRVPRAAAARPVSEASPPAALDRRLSRAPVRRRWAGGARAGAQLHAHPGAFLAAAGHVLERRPASVGDEPAPPREDHRRRVDAAARRRWARETGIRRMTAAREPCTFSVIVPLYDCRDAGTNALRAALAQTLPRHRFEVIAVIDAGARARPDALLAKCDRVVESDADFGAVEPEIALFAAGSRAASGDWLFFTEGHTVLDADALAAIAHHLEREPGCAIVCGRRRNHARTRLGLLVGGNNDAHEAHAQRHGDFTLGANSPIRRDAFVALGGLDARFAR